MKIYGIYSIRRAMVAEVKLRYIIQILSIFPSTLTPLLQIRSCQQHLVSDVQAHYRDVSSRCEDYISSFWVSKNVRFRSWVHISIHEEGSSKNHNLTYFACK
eukprot:TRINITY_DN1868_c0_g1_i1.p2 TRINITY_DN1868_c0_g1~~TRINITY_DN1868_c0_g1_i1.p2  ORF type:complete len:102 (-),score=4.83 TRINITY_DN1868_c0_g1_i1:69-374(-)